MALNGIRVKNARIVRGYTITDLANQIGVTKQFISLCENGKSDLSPETLMKLSNTLGFPKNYFYEESSNNVNPNEVFFRSLSSTTKTSRYVQSIYLDMIENILKVIGNYIDYPLLNLPEEDLSHFTPKEAALKLREHWKLGALPITNIIKIMEINGFIITSLKADENKVDAYSKKIKIDGVTRPLIVLCEDKRSAVRRQFDAAHELAHMILHDDLDLEIISSEKLKIIEREADDFASEFLLPEEGFRPDLIHPKDISSYKDLKRKWNVSMAAMIVKARKMNVLDINEYQYVMRKFSSKGFRTCEPLDDEIVIAKPLMIKKAVDLILSNNLVPQGDFVGELSRIGYSYGSEMIEYLLGLKPGYLRVISDEQVVVSLKDYSESKKNS